MLLKRHTGYVCSVIVSIAKKNVHSEKYIAIDKKNLRNRSLIRHQPAIPCCTSLAWARRNLLSPTKCWGLFSFPKLKQKYIHVQLKATCQIRQTQKSELLGKFLHKLDRLMWKVILKEILSLRFKKKFLLKMKSEICCCKALGQLLPTISSSKEIPRSCGHKKFNFKKWN